MLIERPLRAVHVSFHADRERRTPEQLLDAWPTLTEVSSALRRGGVDVVVVQRAHTTRTVERDGVSYRFVDDAARIPRRIIALVASLEPDVIHVRGIHHLSAVAALARSGDAPVLIQDHATRVPSGWRSTAWRWALRSVAGAAFTTAEQARPFVDAGLLRADMPIFPVLEGSSTFTPGARDEARRATGMFGDPCLLWTGRLDDNKDPLTLLAAVERVARKLPDVRLWMCYGKAPLLDVVTRRIAESPVLRERVVLLGTRPHAEMELRHRAADFYVQASHHEASGFSLLEAMACGTTPIVTDIPAARRIVGDTGALIPIENPSALAAAIGSYWLTPDGGGARRAPRSVATAARVRGRFDTELSYDAIARELRLAYEALAAARV